MKLRRLKLLASILAAITLLGFGCNFGKITGNLLGQNISQPQPCEKPITYSVANLDPRFGLTNAELLNDMQQAEKIWESPINRQLFEYSPTGDLKINFVYDYRQKATDAMRKIGIVIEDSRSSYDALKARHDLLVSSYNKEKARIEALIATFNADEGAYEKDVNYWNSRGGAPKAEYNRLEQKKIDLEKQVTTINQAENSLNETVDTINSSVIVLNKLIATLNLQVNTYNEVGSTTGRQFNEGEYVSNASGTIINVFQFNDAKELLEVLAHELGHALGMEHLDNPEAIMYYLNEGNNEKLTADDLAALKKACGIK
jgi:Matrixin